ncbi:magnesium-dependent phosphatase 1-like isoform X2 [Cimex lectularius]|uniref:Magnesium-dependent phosphatase n=1 Tax=Cimex lectularius TaxID=79782 RepID=A0A8I6SSB1_CIMLE|nr:magnesium-dependent phosphatase 1-like isoform X2 [Cimex lectularius]
MIPGLSRNPKFPKLVVFDLDYTLWPFYSDVHVQPPFHNTSEGHVYDSKGVKVTVYAEVNRVLERVHKMNIMMAVASRSTASTGAKDLMHHLGWDKYFSAREVFPGSKVTHFHKIKNQTHVHFTDMLFFDDDPRNIKDISDLGITCILVIGGMKMADLQKGFDTYKRNHQGQF